MCDQRLFLGQFQFEFVTQELSQALLDLFGLGFRSGETKEMIVCVAAVADGSVMKAVLTS